MNMKENSLRRPSIDQYKVQTNTHYQQSEEGTRPLEDQLMAEDLDGAVFTEATVEYS